MPIDYKKYPPDWKTRIRPDILRRANDRCEICGVKNGEMVWREECTLRFNYGPLGAGRVMHKYKVKVVLTIAHLDHDRTNNDYGNLKALCQRCHLLLDKEQHARNARLTRARQRRKNEIEAGQLMILGILGI